MHLDFATQEVSCKLVYCGPGLSGKTTNLEFIHSKAPPDRRGALASINTEGDRTLFFDYLPLSLGEVGGATTRFRIYTVPGQVYYAATRRLVLQGADGLVFVADSHRDRMEENVDALEELEQVAPEILGRPLSQIPMVLQLNKRDLSEAAPRARMERLLNRHGCPSVAASAHNGEGVLTTLRLLSHLVLERSHQESGRAAPTVDDPGSESHGPLLEDVTPDRPTRLPWSSEGSGVVPLDAGDPVIGQRVGGCRIHTKLGEGGMGAVYLAHHEGLSKDVVVKVLKPAVANQERRVRRFFREARLAAKLEHPNIVSVQDVGTNEQGLHYILMQYVEGENAHERIQRKGRHAPRTATKIVLGVARALGRLHAAGIIHRDVKAENVVITPRGDVKLIDFGLAKDLHDEAALTIPGAMVGTPTYMAPEIGRVSEVDGRADIYSLGLTFYYLLTREPPFAGYGLEEILTGQVELPPPGPELPARHRAVLTKMLAWRRDDRYADVLTLTQDLLALLQDEPISCPQVGWQLTAPRGRARPKASPRPAPPPAVGIPPTIPPDVPDGALSSSGASALLPEPGLTPGATGWWERPRLLQAALAASGVLILVMFLALQSAWARAEALESVNEQMERLVKLDRRR